MPAYGVWTTGSSHDGDGVLGPQAKQQRATAAGAGVQGPLRVLISMRCSAPVSAHGAGGGKRAWSHACCRTRQAARALS